MGRLISYFFSNYHFKLQSLWFKRSLYAFLIYKCMYWLWYFDLLFGMQSIIDSHYNALGSSKDLTFLLLNYSSATLKLSFICLVLFISLSRLSIKTMRFKYTFVLDLLLWYVVLNIHNSIYPTLSGGNFLLNQFLLFNCLLLPSSRPGNAFQEDLKMSLHNIAVLSIILQIMLLYFLSGLAKIIDSDWLKGNAVIYTMQVKQFMLSDTLFTANYWRPIKIALNFVILFYQLSFPFFIWIKAVKKSFLLFGILMHLYIALVMGLPDFGIIMLISYLYFWPFKNIVS